MNARLSGGAWDSLKTPKGGDPMITSDVLAQALPGRENAKDWLTMKIVEYRAKPMDDQVAEKLSAYNGAYNAMCQWDEEERPKQKSPLTPEQFSMEAAKEWTQHMQNEDGTSGPHWTLEQAKQIMAQRKINYSPHCFWAVLNSIYSDYSTVAKKHGLGGNLEFYIDMAKSWIDDKDAVSDKVYAYYTYIVRQ